MVPKSKVILVKRPIGIAQCSLRSAFIRVAPPMGLIRRKTQN